MAATGADETDSENTDHDADVSNDSEDRVVQAIESTQTTVENIQNQIQEIEENNPAPEGPEMLKVYSKATLDVFEGNDVITIPWPHNLPLYADEVHVRWVKGIWRFKVGSGTVWGKGKPDFQSRWNGEYSFSDESSDVIVEVSNTRE